VHFVGLRAKALEMFVHVDDDRRHAEPCTLILKLSDEFLYKNKNNALKNRYG
jgi:hypothetical protein